MIEDADSSKGQVLRADHLFHVTMKYTRTGDVIKNIIKRFVNSLEYAITEILEKRKVQNIPTIALMKANMLKKRFPRNKTIQEMIKFYLYIKKIDKSKYGVECEYRKHVAILVDDETIDIPKLRELLDQTKEYVNFANELK